MSKPERVLIHGVEFYVEAEPLWQNRPESTDELIRLANGALLGAVGKDGDCFIAGCLDGVYSSRVGVIAALIERYCVQFYANGNHVS